MPEYRKLHITINTYQTIITIVKLHLIEDRIRDISVKARKIDQAESVSVLCDLQSALRERDRLVREHTRLVFERIRLAHESVAVAQTVCKVRH